MLNIRKGDIILTCSGNRGIVTSEPFKASSYMDYWQVGFKTDVCEIPLQVISIAQIWRNGVRVDNLEQTAQMSLFLE